MLVLRLLGAVEIRLNDRPLVVIERSPLLAELLAYLALDNRRAHPRSVLAAQFWPDLPDAQARRYLNTHLWRLNHALRPAKAVPYLLRDKQTVQFNPECAHWLDAIEFDRLSKRSSAAPQTTENVAQLERAVGLYRGDFMPGCFSDWCLQQRERLHEQYLFALQTLARACHARHDFEAAQAWLQELLQADPLREAAQAQLIELLLQAGRPAEARAQFERYAALWRSELKLAPSASIAALLQANETATAPAVIGNDLQAEHARLGQLRQQWQELRPGAGPRREAAGDQLAECAGRLGCAFKERQAIAQAREHLELAVGTLGQLPATPRRAEQERALREALDPLYDLRAERDKQSANLQRLAELINLESDVATRCDLLARQAWLSLQLENYPETLLRARDLLNISRQIGKDRDQEQSLAWRLIGIAYDQTGDFTAALEAYQAALVLDEERQDALAAYYGLNNVGSVLNNLGRYSEALAYLNRAQALTPAGAPLYRRATVTGNIGSVLTKLGQFPAAADCLREAMSQVIHSGDRARECWLGAKLAYLYLRRGEGSRALLTAQHYLQIAEDMRAIWNCALLSDLLALIYLELEEGVSALTWAGKTINISQRSGLWRYSVRGLMRRAQACLRLRQVEPAYDDAQLALSTFRERAQPLEERPELFFTLARSAQFANKGTAAEEAHQRAHAALQEIADAIVEAEWRRNFLDQQPTCDLCCS